MNKTIYQVIGFELNVRRNRLIPKRNKDGSVDCHERDLGCYTTWNKAHDAIKKHVSVTESYSVYCGFVVYERRLDDVNNANYDYNSYYRMRSYNRFGYYIASSYGYTKDNRKYCGTNPSNIVFPLGDVIFHYCEGKFYPAIVKDIPYTKKEWKRKFHDCDVDFDNSEDCYLVMSVLGHAHVLTTMAFPCTIKLSKKEINIIKKQTVKYFTHN